MVLKLAILILGIHQVLLGPGTASTGLPDVAGRPGVFTDSLYTLYTESVVDLTLGISVLLLSILLMVEWALKVVNAATM